MNIREFQKIVWDFYSKNGRRLPWREATDPYKIVVSEIMLQQTQVSRVLLKYQEFVTSFPDFPTLSQGSVLDVLKVWQGLGYNRRALYLREIAIKVVRDFEGNLPTDPKVLVGFLGIGKATAASILVFSFNTPLVFIETNIRRVFIRHFFNRKEQVSDKELIPFVEQALDRKNPREWYYALMDYGTYLAKITQNPNRKSKHYVKQSRFEGSLRQVRGEILRRLLKRKEINVEVLGKELNKRLFQEAFKQLEKEGFLAKKDGIIFLKS